MRVLISVSVLLFVFIAITGYNYEPVSICKPVKVIGWYDSAKTKIQSEFWLCNNMLDSTYTEWDVTGQIIEIRHYRKGIKVGVWEKIKYETQGNLGWHLYTHHVNNLIVEERRYYIKNGMEILHDYYVYKYIQSDTLRVHRSFDITTGYMVQLDTLKNSVVEGIFKLWSDKDGTLYREFCVRDNILIYEKNIFKNGTYIVIHYYQNNVQKEELTYNCQGFLIEEKYYDENGNLIKHKTKNKKH
jgi:antitoxin component YwqK of YwqJK toxin-antitoxin module